MLQGKSRAVTFGAVVFVVAGVVLAIANIMLVKQNRQLREALKQQVRRLEPQVGALVPPLRGWDLEGKPLRIEYGGNSPRTLLLVFSPKCRVCDDNWPYWRSLLKSGQLNGLRVVLVNLSSEVAREYLELNWVAQFPVLAEVDPKDVLEYNLRFTPQTVIISSEGRVEKVWTGVLEGERLAQAVKAAQGGMAALE